MAYSPGTKPVEEAMGLLFAKMVPISTKSNILI